MRIISFSHQIEHDGNSVERLKAKQWLGSALPFFPFPQRQSKKANQCRESIVTVQAISTVGTKHKPFGL